MAIEASKKEQAKVERSRRLAKRAREAEEKEIEMQKRVLEGLKTVDAALRAVKAAENITEQNVNTAAVQEVYMYVDVGSCTFHAIRIYTCTQRSRHSCILSNFIDFTGCAG